MTRKPHRKSQEERFTVDGNNSDRTFPVDSGLEMTCVEGLCHTLRVTPISGKTPLSCRNNNNSRGAARLQVAMGAVIVCHAQGMIPLLGKTPLSRERPFKCAWYMVHGTYKSKYPLLIKKTSFEVKHCKIETVVLDRSAQAPKLKRTYS